MSSSPFRRVLLVAILLTTTTAAFAAPPKPKPRPLPAVAPIEPNRVGTLSSPEPKDYAVSAVRKGLNYEYGNTVPQSYSEAARWYLIAAREGDPDGQFGIALLLTMGRGVPQQFAQAYLWANVAAAAKGTPKLIDLRDKLAARLTPEALALAQRQAMACWKSNFKDCD
jgi:TPR repeat protein